MRLVEFRDAGLSFRKSALFVRLAVSIVLALFTAQVPCLAVESNGQKSSSEVSPQISFGAGHVCALSHAGAVACWGDNRFGQSEVPASLGQIMEIEAGKLYTCAVSVSYEVRCWGYKNGNGSSQPNPLGKVKKISTKGETAICAVMLDRSVRCWGSDYYGLLEMPADLADVTQVSLVGGISACALKISKDIECWGDSHFGQLSFPKNSNPVKAISPSSNGLHLCAVYESGFVSCWGNNNFGQTDVPSDLGPVSKIVTGGSHTCVLLETSEIRCWGRDNVGQLEIPSSEKYLDVAAGEDNTCAVRLDGSLICVGDNSYGQIVVPDSLPPLLSKLSLAPNPRITGVAKPGQELSVLVGLWDADVSISFQWMKNGDPVAGESESTYKVLPEDVGHQFTFQVRGIKKGYFPETASSNIVNVTAGELPIFSVKTVGALRINHTATSAVSPVFSGAVLRYQWLLDGKAIKGATSASYKPLSYQKGHKISLKVTQLAKGYLPAAQSSVAIKVW